MQLSRPLVFFDLETTGVDVSTARIVEIAMIRMNPDGGEETLVQRVNPGIPIPEEASKIHGIRDADVADSPTFEEIAPKVLAMLQGADLAGYNAVRFDIPLLAEELYRCGHEIDPDQFRMIDALIIYQQQEPRTLSAAYKKFCGKTLENAHSALADTAATREILFAEIEKYPNLPETIDGVAEYCKQFQAADVVGRLRYNDAGEIVFGFGKFQGQRVKDVLTQEPGYYNWMMRSDFSIFTKRLITKLYEELKG